MKSNTFKVERTLCPRLQREQGKNIIDMRNDHGRNLKIQPLAICVLHKDAEIYVLKLVDRKYNSLIVINKVLLL